MSASPDHYRDVLASSQATYIRVRPEGLCLDGGAIRTHLICRIARHGDARTLYRARQPVCRSLDGRASASDPARSCGVCDQRLRCTPQILLDMRVAEGPYRLLLAYTSARNFIAYLGLVRAQVTEVDTLITVRDRGRWGELTFARFRPYRTRRRRDAGQAT